MLTLDRIRDEILELMKFCETNPDQAESGVQEIFFMLMCADQPFYLIYAEGAPLLSPAASDEKNLYLRLFTHEEVADKYIRRTGTDYCEHTLLDILQIGRWAFLRGAYGFILNEGDRWLRISIPELLSLFLTRIYGNASFCEQNCVEVISLINEIRLNDSYHYGMKMSEDGGWTGENQPGLTPLVTISELFHVPTDTLKVERDGTHFAYSRDSIQKALDLCGYAPDITDPFSETDYNSEDSWKSSFANGSWRTKDPEGLALTFEPISPQESDETQEPVNRAERIEVPVAAPVSASDKSEKKGNLRSLLQNLFRKKPAKQNSGQEIEESPPEQEEPDHIPVSQPQSDSAITLPTEPESPQAEEISPGREEIADPVESTSHPEADGEENSSMSGEKTKRKKKEMSKGKKRFLLITMAGLAILLIVAGFFTVRHLQYKENLKNFRTYIVSQDYASAYLLYQDAKLVGSEADEYLTNEVDGLILRYANNEISAEELSASLKALSNFSSLSQELEIAKLTASKLEESKNAYVIGKESTDIYERLNTWRQVVQLDAVNYAAVQQAVEDNESRYVDVLRADIEYYRTRILEFASDRVDVLAYWYPENEYVPALVKEYSSIQTVPLSYYPISVSDIRIHQETNSYWTLYIQWNNLSVKTINTICFSVVAVGEDGEIVTCEDVQGKWTIFDAQDRNQYEPGEEPSFARYYWNGAFYGPNVRTVRLTAVNIEYRDGSSASYTSDIDLDSIMTR